MELRGKGDLWLAGERLPNVGFSHAAPVEIVGGRHDGEHGRIALLMNCESDPAFLVTLQGGAGDVRVRQSALRHLE